MKKSIKGVLTLALIICLCGVNIAQQSNKDKKKSAKPKNKKETVIKKERVQIPDSVKQEIELHQGLLLKDSTSTN
jgi:hypothetical protein